MTETQVIPGSITVRYWAGAKHAAGTDRDELETDTALTLAEVRGRAVALHPGTRLGALLGPGATVEGAPARDGEGEGKEQPGHQGQHHHEGRLHRSSTISPGPDTPRSERTIGADGKDLSRSGPACARARGGCPGPS